MTRRLTLCPLHNHFHLTELLCQLFLGLPCKLAVPSPDGEAPRPSNYPEPLALVATALWLIVQHRPVAATGPG